MPRFTAAAILLSLLLRWGIAHAGEDMAARLLAVEDRSVQIRYEMKDKAAKIAAAQELVKDAAAIAAEFPGNAEALVWHARALLVEAEVRNNFAALSLAKEARRLLEQAEGINPTAAGGIIQTTLGMIYYEMPGWPIGFGDRKKAREYLERALALDPNGMDTNYFFGDYLVTLGWGREAIPFLEQAAAAPIRPGHERADKARLADIQESLDKARRAR